MVSAFAGSPGALARLDVSAGPERWLASLGGLRPDLDLDPAGALLSTWSDDPWVRAAYSTSPPPELAERAPTPLGPLAFAGEHLGGEFAALMEGAIRSGRAAARGLLQSRAWALASRWSDQAGCRPGRAASEGRSAACESAASSAHPLARRSTVDVLLRCRMRRTAPTATPAASQGPVRSADPSGTVRACRSAKIRLRGRRCRHPVAHWA